MKKAFDEAFLFERRFLGIEGSDFRYSEVGNRMSVIGFQVSDIRSQMLDNTKFEIGN